MVDKTVSFDKRNQRVDKILKKAEEYWQQHARLFEGNIL